MLRSKYLYWAVGLLLLAFVILFFSVEEVETFVIALVLRLFFFLKKNIISLVTAFFLVKGKFILTLFLKKIAFLSATGLGKRYLIEKVLNQKLKIHFFDHIGDDVKRLIDYIKNNFKDFPIVKQLIAGLAFLGSLSFVGKFMGGMLAMKVFIAKFWSFLLALALKFSTAILYFFTDYLWGSWIAPLIEILLFSWILDWMEKVPFLKKFLMKIYSAIFSVWKYFGLMLEKVFHIPMRQFLRYLALKIKKGIYAFIGYERVSAWKNLQELRTLHPNAHKALKQKRDNRRDAKREESKRKEEKKKVKKESARDLLQTKRKKRS